jgi:hypothetical protein
MPANKPIRRSQNISPFGVGAMVDFPKDESLMAAGLDAWPFPKEACPSDAGWTVIEERLQARLGVTHFRLPPDHRDPAPGERYPNKDIPFVRFPRWHYCHHCGGMELLPLFSPMGQRCGGRTYAQQSCANRPEKKRPFLIPMRFVAVCGKGHIQDFPFVEWVHRDVQPVASCRLRARAGRSSAGLTGITIECSCGQKRTLGNIFEFDKDKGGALHKIGCDCLGLRPWLGEFETERPRCGEYLRVLQRGASNVYFPNVVSSIYLPLWAEAADRDIIKALEDPTIWSLLSAGLVSGKIAPERCEIVAGMRHLNKDDLLAAANRKLAGQPVQSDARAQMDEEQFRQSEYEALGTERGGEKTDLFIKKGKLEEYSPSLTRYFSKVCLVHKLRETRALSGFTRILPPDGQVGSDRLQPLKLDARIDWLPAIVVRGEGLFLEFDSAELDPWLAANSEIQKRVGGLNHRYNFGRIQRGQEPRPLSPKFVMMHTLAHILINQLSFDCGYGSASLRERIYCDFKDQTHPMQGILIYTASGDSEGTMGGLVRQGQPDRFEATLLQAMRSASWCSSDPVCIESAGQGADNANLAACHGCCLLPETSCEEGNRLLDRALLVGTPEMPGIGFFSNLL